MPSVIGIGSTSPFVAVAPRQRLLRGAELDSVVTGIGALSNGLGDNVPSGQYAAIDMTVEDLGDDEEFMSSPGRVLVDSIGTEHGLGVPATGAHDGPVQAITLQPGESGKMTIVHDIPVDAEPDHMLLKDHDVMTEPVRLDLG